MDPKMWRRVDEIYHGAAARPPTDRAAFFDGACSGDDEVRKEVESLLSQEGVASGNDPVWRRDGRELFYRHGDRMMAVPVSANEMFNAGPAQELWRGPYSHGMSSSCGAPGLSSSNYDVTPDGQRFLMIQDDDVATTSSDKVVLVRGFAQELARQRA